MDEFVKLCDAVNEIVQDLIDNQDIVETTARECMVSYIIGKLQEAKVLRADLYDKHLNGIEHYDVFDPQGVKIKEVAAKDGKLIWPREVSESSHAA